MQKSSAFADRALINDDWRLCWHVGIWELRISRVFQHPTTQKSSALADWAILADGLDYGRWRICRGLGMWETSIRTDGIAATCGPNVVSNNGVAALRSVGGWHPWLQNHGLPGGALDG